jgi:prepilin-type N-terminal cleavage/methylation domain-containing protein
MDTIVISPKRTSKGFTGPKGFTLLEILISLALIAGIMTVVLPRLGKGGDSPARKIARHLTVLSKDIRTSARLKQRTFRLVINMVGDTHSYWVESAPGLAIPKSRKELEEQAKNSEDGKVKSEFQKEEKFTKKSYDLPKNLYFGLVETAGSKEALREGIGYVYYSPQGLAEPAVIQLTNRKELTWSFVVNPLTAHMDMVAKAVSLKDTEVQ